MVSSIYTKWSTIARLLPCFENIASEIYPITKKVISDIESCDLFVVTLITDNYPLNVRLFKSFFHYITAKILRSSPCRL